MLAPAGRAPICATADGRLSFRGAGAPPRRCAGSVLDGSPRRDAPATLPNPAGSGAFQAERCGARAVARAGVAVRRRSSFRSASSPDGTPPGDFRSRASARCPRPSRPCSASSSPAAGLPGRCFSWSRRRVSVPTALGALRPAILLPVCAVTGLSPEALEAVLAHELAHIRRHDYLVNLLQTAAETLLFYHPAVWWVSRRIRIGEGELLRRPGRRRDRRRPRLRPRPRRARGDPDASESDFGPAVAADGGSLRRRIARLLPSSSPRAEETPRWLAGLLALVMLATIGAAARVSDFAQAPEDGSSSPQIRGSAPRTPPGRSGRRRRSPPRRSDSSAAPQSGGQRKEASHSDAVAGSRRGGRRPWRHRRRNRRRYRGRSPGRHRGRSLRRHLRGRRRRRRG